MLSVLFSPRATQCHVLEQDCGGVFESKLADPSNLAQQFGSLTVEQAAAHPCFSVYFKQPPRLSRQTLHW